MVKFELTDYRDVKGPFDRVVSVGMIEHVGAPHLPEYFAKTYDLLANDGIALTHTIGRTNGPGTTDKWTRKYIFPGGYIPAMSELVSACEKTGWEIADVEVLRYHYAHTLAEWYRRACLHEAEITALYDQRLFRMWQFYLVGAEQGFRNGTMVNFHVQAAKRAGVLPVTRDYITAEAARLFGAKVERRDDGIWVVNGVGGFSQPTETVEAASPYSRTSSRPITQAAPSPIEA